MEKYSIATKNETYSTCKFVKIPNLMKRTALFLLFSFMIASHAFGQTWVQDSIDRTAVGNNVRFNNYTWKVAMKKTHTDGYKYAMLYGMTSFHSGIFGSTNDYFASTIRNVFTNRYATNSEYNELRQIAVVPTLNTSANFSSTARTELPNNPPLASATGTTQDVIFLPTVQDVWDIDMNNNFNVAGTFGIMSSGQRLITRTPQTSPPNICGFRHTDGKTLEIDGGLPPNPNTQGNYQFRPCIWVRISPIAPVIDSITAPSAAICSGGNLTLSTPTVNANGFTITSQGWQIETSAGSFTNITLPHQIFYNDNGKKLRYYAIYSNDTVYSNEVIVTVNPLPMLTQPDSLTFCAEDYVSSISFTGTNLYSTVWEVISGSGISIGMNANNGTGNIAGFMTSNITSSPIEIALKVTPTSNAGCTGDAKIFTITVNPLTTVSHIVTRDTTILLGSSVNLNDLASAQNIENPVFNWYNSPFESIPIDPIIVPSDESSRYYFVSVAGDGYCEGGPETRKIVTVNVTNLEEIEICHGATVTFKATPTHGGTNPSFVWKKNNEIIVGAGDSIYSYRPESADTISCEVTSNADCASPATVTSVRVAIKFKPGSEGSTQITANDATICSGTTATLFASSTEITGEQIIRWYASATETTVLHTGKTYTTDVLTTTTTFYVSLEADDYCEGEANAIGRKAVTVTVKPYSNGSTMITVPDTTICLGERVTLEASAATATGTTTFRWYENEASTKVLRTGDTYTTEILTKTTTFYVSVEDDNYCEGLADATGRKAVTVTVTRRLKPSVSISIE